MKIQANIVQEKCRVELTGYVDFENTEINYSTFENVDDIAIRALVYYVRGVANDFKFCLSYFAAKGIKTYKIMSTIWKGDSILELTFGLKVVVAVSFEASANRKRYKTHKFVDPVVEEVKSVRYWTINLYSSDRYITFADVQHLIKTRNCIYYLGCGKYTSGTIKILLYRIIMFKL